MTWNALVNLISHNITTTDDADDIFWKLEKNLITFNTLQYVYKSLQHQYRFAHRKVSISMHFYELYFETSFGFCTLD